MLIALAINILYFALGVVVLCAVVWIALWAVGQIKPVPEPIVRVVWAVVAILCLIALLMTIQGGGVGIWGLRLPR